MTTLIHLFTFHTSKTCVVKLGLTNWKSETEGRKNKFLKGLNQTFKLIFQWTTSNYAASTKKNNI